MEKLEGTNTWADLLSAIGQGRNSAVMGGLTRVFVHELVNSFLNRPSASSRCLPSQCTPNPLVWQLCNILFKDAKTHSQGFLVFWHAVQVSCGGGGVCISTTAAPASDGAKLFNQFTPPQPHSMVHHGLR